MASDPYFDPRRGAWKMKYRPDPAGGWLSVTLCKHPTAWSPSKPPKKPPQEAVDRAAQFAEIEYRAKHGIEAAPARARGLAEYLAGYADAHALSARKGSNGQLRRHARNFLAFAEAAGIASVQAVTRAHCRDYLESRAKSVARSSLVTERGYLVGAWSRAVADGLIAANPWAHVAVPGKKVEARPTFWSSEEIARIAAACAKPWHADLVLVLANTGLRISTALRMEWSWVDWPAGTIRVPVGVEDVKTGYVTALTRGARDVLTRMNATARGSALVFPNPNGGGVVASDSARAAIGRAIKRARVKAGTPHDFRHSYGRALALAGVPDSVIRTQLGHASLAMTQVYTKTGEEHAAKYADEFGVGEGSG